MSNNYWDDEDEDEVTTPSATDGNAMKELRKAYREQKKENDALRERVTTFEKAQSERTVKEILEKQGVNTKAARLILKDLEDVSEESINGWLTENGDLLGFTPAPVTPAVSDETRAAIVAQDSLTQGALSPERNEDLEYRIENAQSQEELNNILWSAQNS